MNEETGEIGLKEVEKVSRSSTHVIYSIQLNGNTEINTTAYHQFYLDGEGWVGVIHLKIADRLLTKDGIALVTNIKKIRHEEAVPVFNFSIKDWVSYFVSKFQVYVNNDDCSKLKDELKVGTDHLDALRKKWNVPNTNTIAVGKTDVEGLEGMVFEGGSPRVRKEAGLPDLDDINPNRSIQSSGKIPSAVKHAEEGVANQFVEAVEDAGIKPKDVMGTLKIHQSNTSGVCPTCLSGLGNPEKPSGVIKQLSEKYRDLTIEVTPEITENAKVNGRLNFKVKNGQYITD